jgi:hypothetical protein
LLELAGHERSETEIEKKSRSVSKTQALARQEGETHNLGETAMQYLALIYSKETTAAAMTPEEQQAIFGGYMAFEKEVKEAGVYVAGEALKPTTTATTVRVRDDKRLTTDGPFAETKEQLGGFYLFECKDLDQAIHWASKIPTANVGSVEVRPVMKFD